MANRDNHYEAAFEAYLRSRCIAYVAVDEARRTQLAGGTLKSLDFIVSIENGISWLVDVKGRRFPSGDEQKQYWKNWSTRDDLVSLVKWQKLFGASFRSLLVFAYHVVGDRSPLPAEQLFTFRDRIYGFVGIEMGDYAPEARMISPSWDTVAMSVTRFRELARPMEDFLPSAQPVVSEIKPDASENATFVSGGEVV